MLCWVLSAACAGAHGTQQIPVPIEATTAHATHLVRGRGPAVLGAHGTEEISVDSGQAWPRPGYNSPCNTPHEGPRVHQVGTLCHKLIKSAWITHTPGSASTGSGAWYNRELPHKQAKPIASVGDQHTQQAPRPNLGHELFALTAAGAAAMPQWGCALSSLQSRLADRQQRIMSQ